MKIYKICIIAAFAACFCSCRSSEQVPPIAKKIPYEFYEFGNTRVDNYFWMRLSDEQKNATTPDAQTQDVLDYLNAENAYLKWGMAGSQKLQETIFEEIKGRIKQDDSSVPYLENGYYYFSKYEAGKEYPFYYRRADVAGAEDELLLDVNRLAEGKAYCSVGEISVSPDNNILAYSVDFLSRRRQTLFFKDLRTGETLKDTIPDTSGTVIWASDNKTIFYIGKDIQTLRSCKLYKHILGSDSFRQDELCYFEEDNTFRVSLSKSKSGRYILVESSHTLATEFRYIDADRPEETLKLFLKRTPNHLYSLDHINGEFFLLSNRNALNFKLMKTKEGQIEERYWKEVIGHRTEVMLANMILFNSFIVLEERENGLKHFRILNMKNNSEQFVPFSEEVYTAGLGTNLVPELKELQYQYASMTTPASTYAYNMETGAVRLLKETEVPGGFDKSQYETKRLWAPTGDGVMVPISIVYKKGYLQDGKGKLLMHGYGSYGNFQNANFNPSVFSLLDRGFAFAIAHIRGGGELGRAWYDAGKLLNKKNTFTDFNDCARYLIAQKYVAPDGLFATGLSAGGLLMGAIVNMEPQLYKGVIAGVPFVDIISTTSDATIPLTALEWDEWGNPANKEHYDYILSYSPYDQVKAHDYPHMLVTTGYWDSQVQYWEPAKWVAKLRDMKTDNNKLYLYCDMDSGHGGVSGRFERLRKTAMEYTFILSL